MKIVLFSANIFILPMNTLTNLFQLFLHCRDILQKTICIGLHDRYISNKSDKNIATVANNTNNGFS
jgi:hypothetical protein